MNINGRIIKSDGTALEASGISFELQVKDPSGNCVIFQEGISGIDMTSSNGYFSIVLGSGTRSFPTSAISLLDVFSNASTFICSGGATYLPAVTDSRRINIQFNDGVAWRTFSPDSVVRAVPYAWRADAADKLDTHVVSDFVLKTGIPTCTGGTYLTYDGTSLTCQTIVSGSVTLAGDVTGTASTNSVVKLKGIGVSGTAPAAGQVLKYDGTNWSPAADAVGSGTVTSVALGMPTIFSVTGSPVTSSGVFNVSLAVQSANTFFAGPTTGTVAPTFRALNSADFPSSLALSITSLTTSGNITSANTITASTMTAGAFTYTSDRRLKTNIRTIEDPLKIVGQLRGVRFDWKANQSPDVGFIAQEVESVVPELVKTGEGPAGPQTKSVKYGNIVAIAIEAIKSLWTHLTDLESRVSVLENQNSQLQKENSDLRLQLQQQSKIIDERLSRLENQDSK